MAFAHYSLGMAVAAEAPAPGRAPDWARKYPPLLSLFVALLIALVVMPSALNLPQTNPTQTLEYAPVPPTDDEPPPPQGNLSALGLGSSSAVETGGALGGNNEAVIPPLGKGVSPSTKRCVGSPPRQTEDPLAPPCVAFFQGDNFGSTYQGVTKDEIRLLIYIDGNIAELNGSKGQEERPDNTYFDLFQPPDPKGEHLQVEGYRGWQRYFNDRFQTYGRTVHFFVYFSGADKTPENRRADAADNFAKIRPFAVVSDASENEVDYVEAMAKRGVLNFGTFTGRPYSFFRQYPKLVWGQQPAVEYQAEEYANYVCKKVVGKPSAMAGPALNNRERKLGMFHTSDENFPGLIVMAELVRQKVEACGGVIEADATFPVCCFAQDNSTTPDYAATAVAQFQQQGITTILWPGGIEGNFGKASSASGYVPEWIILGDGTLDANNPVRLSQNTGAFDKHAIVVSPQVFQPDLKQQRCYQAFREANKTRPDADMTFICQPYTNLFQLFTGIQVAGPRLGPSTVDKGFHAIPAVESKDPTTAACFYNTSDYTCVKDAQLEYWDASGQAPGDQRPGCWRSIEGGKRYLPAKFPDGNINAQIKGNEPCNGYSIAVLVRPA